MNRLLEAAHALSDEPDLSQLLDRIIASAVEITRADRGFLALHEEGGLQVRAACDARGGHDTRTASHTLLEKAFRENRPLLMADVNEDVSLSLARSVQRHRLRAVCAVPLRTPREVIGAVCLDHPAIGMFDDSMIDALQGFAAIASIAIENRRLRRELDEACGRPPLPAIGTASRLIGESGEIQRVRLLLQRISSSPYPVYLHGESGTGKELAARILHDSGPRAAGPFVATNCGAIPEPLAESEFFGHARGAFTGADQERAGFFEQADGGTLFLDEIEAMPPFLQDLLLRVVQDGVVRRVGDRTARRVSVRLITASNELLEGRVVAGTFRSDLWYRLNVLRVDLPSLRDRAGDIPTLVRHLLDRISAETGTTPREVSPEAMRALIAAPWPGNVRQLENALRHAATLCAGTMITPADFPDSGGPTNAPPLLSMDEYIRRCVERYEPLIGLKRVAATLGLSRKTLWQRKKTWGLV